MSDKQKRFQMGKYGEYWSDDGTYERVCIEIIDTYYHKNYRSLTEIYHLINELNDYAAELIKENEQLRQKLECCEYEHFKKKQDKIYQKVKKGDLSDFGTLTISDDGKEHWNGVLK